jgi:hypothetical protein
VHASCRICRVSIERGHTKAAFATATTQLAVARLRRFRRSKYPDCRRGCRAARRFHRCLKTNIDGISDRIPATGGPSFLRLRWPLRAHPAGQPRRLLRPRLLHSHYLLKEAPGTRKDSDREQARQSSGVMMRSGRFVSLGHCTGGPGLPPMFTPASCSSMPWLIGWCPWWTGTRPGRCWTWAAGGGSS